jgi:hypothetical protein
VKRLPVFAALLAGALTLPGCSGAGSDTGSAGPAPRALPSSGQPPGSPPPPIPPLAASPSPLAPSAAARKPFTFQVWLIRDGKLFAATRTRPAQITTGRLALSALQAGPTAAERAAGAKSAIGTGTGLALDLQNGIASVRAPAAFYAGDRATARLRQAQVVYTLTQYPTVREVSFERNGQAVAAPVRRATYADLVAAILVTAPAPGARVTSPVQISGSADVYEATVSVRVLDSEEREIATRFTNAAAGTGTRGQYEVSVPYSVAAEQPGTVEVFEVSAKDGSRLNAVRIPVILAR